jgi:hypothetical protein
MTARRVACTTSIKLMPVGFASKSFELVFSRHLE